MTFISGNADHYWEETTHFTHAPRFLILALISFGSDQKGLTEMKEL